MVDTIKRIAATDIDGTILYKWDEISKENKLSLLEFQNKSNNALTLVTGRNYFLVDFLVDELNIKLPIVCSNGSSVIDPITKKYIFKNHFKKDEIKLIMEEFHKNKIDFVMHNDFRAHIIKNDPWYKHFCTSDAKIKFDDNENNKTFYIYNSIRELIDESVKNDNEFVNIVLDCNTSDKINLANKLVNKLNLQSVQFDYPSGAKIEIYKKDVTKSYGLRKLLRHLSVQEDDLYVFGDNVNDICMFEDFKNSFAVDNAIFKLKSLAKEVIENVREGAVGKKLNNLIKEGIYFNI
ncbi:Cof-type HAD-IIB family hydrolase [Spiroplasma turonicum]|uniref:HAD family hydrolase n=1 Tax=Spiroplasma turonicum TaxID=216946 RepID=A0A0K1P661_9MOLU|nr:Cof-type HAD-IIB family hydrolase [Spiroplasma turonicum]AKU79755.1 HAD family hydrolase [Spiroplasma turonicum]ALX70773.1 HAD family hydrolase [Spiroplasma turonicum]